MTLYLFLFGVLGGRLWYVVQVVEFAVYDGSSVVWGDTIPKVLKFTEGGLVVYGAFVGGLIGCSIFLIRRKLPKLATLDLIVPALAIGMFFGRLGCFMNGFAASGLCTDEAMGRPIPIGSPLTSVIWIRGYCLTRRWLKKASIPNSSIAMAIAGKARS